MDFFGHPHEPVNGFPVAVALDVENARAAIPGTGNANVAMTHSSDIGAFVARMLALETERWPEKCWIVGDRLTWNEALVFAERARGEFFFFLGLLLPPPPPPPTFGPLTLLERLRVSSD